MELSKYQGTDKKYIVSGNNILPYILSLSQYIQNSGINIMPYPKLHILNELTYQNDPFGKTAYYDPVSRQIFLYVAGRHIKDVLRSYAHELIHHNQNLNGKLSELDLVSLKDPRYAEKNENLMRLEADAYLRGNMYFRYWEDQYK